MSAVRSVRVRVLPADVELWLAPGERVLDASDERAEHGRAPLPTRCRAANCATCLVRVRRGTQALQPPDERERELLQLLDASPEQRLGCQLSIRNDTGVDSVVISVVAP